MPAQLIYQKMSNSKTNRELNNNFLQSLATLLTFKAVLSKYVTLTKELPIETNAAAKSTNAMAKRQVHADQ